MVADFFTKPLQGKLFRKLKNVITGKVDITTFKEETRVSKERVGKSEHKEEVVTRVFSDRHTEKDKVPEVDEKERKTYTDVVCT